MTYQRLPSRRRYYAEEIAAAMVMRSQRVSWKNISRVLGGSPNSLCRAVRLAKRDGFAAYPPRGTPGAGRSNKKTPVPSDRTGGQGASRL